MALKTGDWNIYANGYVGILKIASVDAKGNLNGTVTFKNEPTEKIIGFWSDDEKKITFIRVISTSDPSKLQIYTGYSFDETLAGHFEGFAGTGATAQRTVYGWYAQIHKV